MTAPESQAVRPSSPPDEQAEGALPRSYLRPCLLLMLAEGPSHGYELLEQVRRLGLRGAEPSALYRSLRAMEREELVTSYWEMSRAGPPRRTYQLSEAGHGALRSSVDSLQDVQRLLTTVLDRYDNLVGRVATAEP
jgi:PadR family transcriptional regulator, regulatory protein PadR